MHKQATKDAQSRKSKQHRNCDIHSELQHDKQQPQHYSGSTVGTVAAARAAVLPVVAYTCNASQYTNSFPLNKGTLSSGRAAVTKEEVVTSDPAVAEEAAASARASRSCTAR
jgi:hypothetical protein